MVKSGTGATLTAAVNGQATVGGLANILPTDAGAQLILSGSTKGNNGTFDILSVVSSTSVVIADAAATVDSGLTWKFVYEKIRGGNYTTQSSGGDACEFDFDIQKASFANTDVGFRCCSDVQP